MALRILQGEFGRVALLNMNAPLVCHAHHHCHLLLKAGGADAAFSIDGVLQPLNAATAVLVNAWEPHAYCHPPHGASSINTSTNASATLILALYIEPAWLAAIQHPLALRSERGYFSRPCVTISPRARRLADDLAAALQSPGELRPDWLSNRLFELMVSVVDPLLARHRPQTARLPVPVAQIADRRIRRAIAAMRENLGAQFDAQAVAKAAGLSRAHFFLRFRQCTNVTPHVYNNVLRMERAILGLAARHASIAELSGDIGFSAPGHFTRFFRQQLGIAPSEYRRVVDLVEGSQAPMGRDAGLLKPAHL
jgi:AraC-like DNA-binding protein